jgi:cytoskeleton protein RodZ
MSDFGAQLKQSREERGISLRQIAVATKISMVALEALERNDLSRLPGGIFSRAFVRAYALEVGLDPDQTVEQFLIEYEQNHSRAAEKAVPEVTADDRAFLERQRRAARWLRGVSISFVILIAALVIGWRVSRNKAASSQDSAASASEASPGQVTPPAVVEPSANAVAPQPAETLPAAAPVAENEVAVRLQFSSDCWVRATVDGTVVLDQVMNAGETREVKPGRDVYLQVGNAGAVRWWINGQPAKTLGRPGQTAAERINRATLDRYVQQ